jgi:subtilisin family serine protease
MPIRAVMPKGPGIAVVALCALGLAGGYAAAGDGATAAAQPQELVVRFKPGAPVGRALKVAGARLVERHGGSVRARVRRGVSVAAVEAALERRRDVRGAARNHRYYLDAVPNDTRWGDLWGLPMIDAPAAWDATQGSHAVVVGVVDSGAQVTHADLDANIWVNPQEADNNVDDDGNGLVDDLKGWDFYGNDDDPADIVGHGTHVAGTIGAEGNNAAGVSGVNWRVKLMPLRVGNQTLSGYAIERAFRYACSKGAKVVNGSFSGSGGYDPTDPIHLAIADCPGTLFVFAAGNTGSNNDSFPRFPCNDPSPNVVCVAASTSTDGLASFSNYGTTNVDLAAPGANILSTVPGGLYDYYDGTSMASPHVAGAAALVLAARPELTAVELKSALLLSVDKKAAYAGFVKTGGRLNIASALGQEVLAPTGLTASSPSHSADWSSNPTVQLVWGGATDANGIGGYSYAFSPVVSFAPDEVKDLEPSVTTLTMPLGDGEHWFHIRAVDGKGNWGATIHVGPLRIDTFAPLRPVPSSPSHQLGVGSTDRTVEIAWSGASDGQSGLDGYAISWTQGSAGAPPMIKNLEETVSRATSPPLAVGTWWFSIRSRDNAGNWSDAVSIGPFVLRVTPPACSVPRLRGLTLVAAKRLLVKRGCALGRVSRVRSRRVRRGRVVAQKPAPGLRLARGARVRVVLSRGRR